MFERFTDSARQVLVLAQDEARLLGHSFIGTEHLLLGILHQDGEVAHVLTDLGVSLADAREQVSETIGLAGGPGNGSPPFTPRAKKVLELALRETLQLGHSYIGTEHILLGLVREGEGVACQVLVMFGIELAEVRQRVVEQLSGLEGYRSPEQSHHQFSAADVRSTSAQVVACSFCGITPPGSGQLVSGKNAFICENCIRRWSTRLGQRSSPVRRSSVRPLFPDPVTPGEQPGEPDSARTEIMSIFANYGEVSGDGRAAMGIEDGGELGWALAAVRANRQSYLNSEVVFTVDEIIFVDPKHAAVWYSISVDGNPVLQRHRGDAVVVDHAWKMARTTFSQLLAMGGINLPPE